MADPAQELQKMPKIGWGKTWMWHLRTCISGERGGAGLVVNFSDIMGLSQPQRFCGSVISELYRTLINHVPYSSTSLKILG